MSQKNKFDLPISDIRKKSTLKEGTRLTNYNKNEIVYINNIPFKFDYRRDKFDIELELNQLRFLGAPKPLSSQNYKLFLTNSGQAAMNSLYFYINKKLMQNKIESHNDYLYVGAYRLQYIYEMYHTKEKQKCLWICSTATQLEKALELKGDWELVIIDSTCWSIQSEHLDKLHHYFSTKCETVIFFRSHSKLDMGGVEYGSLGSMILYSSNEEKLQSIGANLENILGLSGGYAVLDDIPPYLFDSDFFITSGERVKKIETNTIEIKNKLTNKYSIECSGTLIFPDHFKYFFIRFPQTTEEATLNRYIKKLNFLIPKNLPDTKSCASFGFNFPSVSFYPSDEKAGHFFRFCPGVINQEECHILSNMILDVFKK